MHGDYLRRLSAHGLQPAPDRFGARLASCDHARKLQQPVLTGERKKTRRIGLRQNYYNFMYAGTLLETPERVNDDGNSSKLQKLLGPLAAQTPALPCGGDNSDVHKSNAEVRVQNDE
jgi:hypothetical protein